MGNQLDTWPGGATWVFQGTIAEDGTPGTHVCTLVVTPGVGNDMQVIAGRIQDGATATAQTISAFVDDGTNPLYDLYLPTSQTTSGLVIPLPFGSVAATTSTGGVGGLPGLSVSGTMRLVLRVSTTQTSIIQTFALVARIKGGKPTATLADSVGTPTLTTNTNVVF